MEILTGETIQSIPINVLIVNATKFDHEEILYEIQRLMEFIRINSGLHSIYREVLELHYSSPNEIYIPAYVLSTTRDLTDWLEEYEKINTHLNYFIVPIIIVEEFLWTKFKDELEESCNAIYIRKKRGKFCCFTNRYIKAPDNLKLIHKIIGKLDDYTKKSARCKISSLKDSEYDPEKLQDILKEIEDSRKPFTKSKITDSTNSLIELKLFMDTSVKKTKGDENKIPFLPTEGSRTISSIRLEKDISFDDETVFIKDDHTENEVKKLEKSPKKTKKSFATVHLVHGIVDSNLNRGTK